MEPQTVTIPIECLEIQPDSVRSLPPSARSVYACILDHGPASVPELQEWTGLPRRTVAFAISRLKQSDLVAWHQRLDDYRIRYFSVHPRLVHRNDQACAPARRPGAIIRLDGDGRTPSQHFEWLEAER